MILTNEYITQVIAAYFKDKPVKKVYVFGSYARGDANDNSDLDLLIDLDHSKKIGLDFYGWDAELGKTLNKKVEVIANAERKIETSNWDFIVRINKEKISLYEK